MDMGVWGAGAPRGEKPACFVIASLTCPARQSIRILSRTVKHLRTVHVQLFPCSAGRARTAPYQKDHHMHCFNPSKLAGCSP